MVFLVFMYPVLIGQDGVCTFMATGAFFCLLHMRKDYYLIFERRIYMDSIPVFGGRMFIEIYW